MSENSGMESTPEAAGSGPNPGEKDLRGRYVEGNFGKSGAQSGRHADDEEGQYVEGDYGAGGTEGGLPEPLGDKARESGRYVRANYGAAGSSPGRTAAAEVGRYSEGNYGADGTVDPTRKARTGQEAKPEPTDSQ